MLLLKNLNTGKKWEMSLDFITQLVALLYAPLIKQVRFRFFLERITYYVN